MLKKNKILIRKTDKDFFVGATHRDFSFLLKKQSPAVIANKQSHRPAIFRGILKIQIVKTIKAAVGFSSHNEKIKGFFAFKILKIIILKIKA